MRKFVEEHGNEEFSDFKGYSTYLRSFARGDVIFVFHKISDRTCPAFFLTVDYKTERIKNYNLINFDDQDSYSPDTLLATKMALRLYSLKLYALSVDSNSNVFIKTYFEEGPPQLARYTHPKFIRHKHGEKWREIRNGWYERTTP